MIVIGVDFHPEFQQIASVDRKSGEFEERRLQHREEAEGFYPELRSRGAVVRAGMEASGHARWFEHLLTMTVEKTLRLGSTKRFPLSTFPPPRRRAFSLIPKVC